MHMTDLALDSLEIQRFRGFRDLQIKQLGRVNLIVGKNNVGKSSVLEALQLYAGGNYQMLLSQILMARDESMGYRSMRQSNSDAYLHSLKYLFFGRQNLTPACLPIVIGPRDNTQASLSISLQWFQRIAEDEGNARLVLVNPEDINNVEDAFPRVVISNGKQEIRINPELDRYPAGATLINYPCYVASAQGLTIERISQLWDNVALTKEEEQVLKALRILAPGIQGLNFIEYPFLRVREFNFPLPLSTREVLNEMSYRIPIIKLDGSNAPIPLRNLGNGMVRMLGIALSLVNAKKGFLLIDEIENGIHYTALPSLWSLIVRVAEQLDIQVFATTHSWDCIEAFQKATKHESAMLIRLNAKADHIAATLINAEELAIATKEQIEVR